MPLLEVRALAHSFHGVHALDGVDLDVEAGRITGLIGPNGAGKTTLLSCVSGLIPPEAGRVLFDGRDITGGAPPRITQLGLVRVATDPASALSGGQKKLLEEGWSRS